jgi:hypothetical protein
MRKHMIAQQKTDAWPLILQSTAELSLENFSKVKSAVARCGNDHDPHRSPHREIGS